MIQIKEAMMPMAQQQSEPPTLAQPVLPPPPVWAQTPVRQQYIAPPVKPIPLETMVDGFGTTWHVCIHCKKICMYAADDCFLLGKNKGKMEELFKKRKANDLKKGKDAAGPRGKRGRKK